MGAELAHGVSAASYRHNGTRGAGRSGGRSAGGGAGGVEAAQAMAAAEGRLQAAFGKGSAPRALLLSTIASLFPGNIDEMTAVTRRVSSALPQDCPQVWRFRDALQAATRQVRPH